MFKWIVTFAWVTGLLGLIGTGIILFSLAATSKDSPAEPVGATEKVQSEATKKPNETAGTDYYTKNVVSASPAVKIIAPGTGESIEEKSGEVVNTNFLSDQEIAERKEAANRNKYMSAAGLEHLLDDIEKTAVTYNIDGNNVQLCYTPFSKNSTLYNQIEKYLLSKGFTLKEKSLQDDNVKGIILSPLQSSVNIVVGKM